MLINLALLSCILKVRENLARVLTVTFLKLSQMRCKNCMFTHNIFFKSQKAEERIDILHVNYDYVWYYQYCRYNHAILSHISLFSPSLASILIINRQISLLTLFIDCHLWWQFFQLKVIIFCAQNNFCFAFFFNTSI